MRSTHFLSLALLVCGCAKTVRVEVPAYPAVSIGTSTVAVVSDSRECRPIADALVEQINENDGVTVDPRAPVRFIVASCGHALNTDVDVELRDGAEQRRVTVVGRSHAVVSVEVDGATDSHLIGSGRHLDFGSWGDMDVLGRHRAAQRELTRLVAVDLAHQVSPMPRIVQRRVYPRAADGSFRQLHSQAVLAESTGDLREAYRLAELAYHRRPTTRTAAYLHEIERFLVHLEASD